jgi:hypothetical protein
MAGIFQHYLNPMHIYCRLIDLGFSKAKALRICKAIEKVIDVLIYTTI